ncbi:N-acetylglucosamine-6-phosphate deacetylase [Oleiharenicola lentus]|uniref:N-acetylglucosamine-6-phosphate deacetylase n=1 Tax=Oleiharenicola lentus TaxID=2508720 RepID=UPI003F66D541
MSSLLIRNACIVEPGKKIAPGDLLVRDGRIAAFGVVDKDAVIGTPVVEGNGRLLTPGLIDIHTHGIKHSLYERGVADLQSAADSLGQYGVTTVLPTLIPKLTDGWFQLVGEIITALPGIKSVNIPGLHIEGPFMAVGGAACPTLSGDLPLLERILAATGDRLSAMSLSPDAPHVLPVIQRLREKNIPVFLTHTRADVEQTEAALEAGARHATHFYDVFYPPHETDPGVRPVGCVEAILADPRATVDFIADGVHVHPTAIRAAVAAKGWAGVLLITDSNIGAGLPPGLHESPWGFQIRVSAETAARHAENNSLAGSALTMDRGMANLLRWLPLPREQVWAMGTLNPATLLSLGRKGRIEIGADADLVLWEKDLRPARTWVAGQLTYEN